MQRQEGGAEAGREGRRGLRDTALRAGQLGREAGEEVVLRLLGRQDRNRGQHAECIGREEDHLLGGRSLRYGLDDVLDVEDRVRHARVLRYGLVGEVDRTLRAYRHVLEQCVAADGVPDVGLVLLREVDDLGVAAALEVEDAVVVPAVLVVTDELTLRVGRQRGLTRTRQTEEDGRLALLVGVGRAVHRSNALQRQQVVHVGEHTLLHLAAIPGVDDHLHLLREVEDNGRLGVQTEALEVLDLGLRGVEHHEVGLAVLLELGVGRTDEHVLDEVCLPGHLHDEADLQTRVLVGAAEGIHHVELLARELLCGDLLQLLPRSLRHGLVVVLVLVGGPPDRILGGLVHDEELVLGRTARVDARHDVHGTHVGQLTLLVAAQALLGLLTKEFVVGGIVHDLGHTRDPVLSQIHLVHSRLLFNKTSKTLLFLPAGLPPACRSPSAGHLPSETSAGDRRRVFPSETGCRGLLPDFPIRDRLPGITTEPSRPRPSTGPSRHRPPGIVASRGTPPRRPEKPSSDGTKVEKLSDL